MTKKAAIQEELMVFYGRVFRTRTSTRKPCHANVTNYMPFGTLRTAALYLAPFLSHSNGRHRDQPTISAVLTSDKSTGSSRLTSKAVDCRPYCAIALATRSIERPCFSSGASSLLLLYYNTKNLRYTRL